MPDISLTDEQHDRLETVRRDLEDAFVDTYGRTHLEDAIEYLLDTYTPPDERDTTGAYDHIATAEYPTLQQIASDVPDVPGSGIDADEMRGKLLAELGPAELADRLAEIETEATDLPDGTADTSDGNAEGTADTSDGQDDTDATDVSDAGSDTSGGLHSIANRLLQEHGDKWHESDSGEEPYAVELPDGTTEPARTKDDVRQLLFRHY